MSVTRPVVAHEAGFSRGEYAATGGAVTATLIFAQRDVAYAVRGIDENRDGSIDAFELSHAQVALGAAFADRLRVIGDGARCPVTLSESARFEEDAIRLVMTATCAATPANVTVDFGPLALLPFGHRHLAHVEAGPGAPFEAALTLSKKTFSFAPAPGSVAAPSTPSPPSARALFVMGLAHIAIGWDHLAFLLGLLVVGGRWRALVAVVTAFTLGHSLSLGLASFGVVSPSPRVIEPLIAASIVYVGIENLLRGSDAAALTAKRWRLTAAFGLVHGFGFATALREVAVPRAQLPLALFLFNLGVEAGQLAAIALVAPLIAYAHRRAWFRERGARAISAAIAVAGGIWVIARIASGSP